MKKTGFTLIEFIVVIAIIAIIAALIIPVIVAFNNPGINQVADEPVQVISVDKYCTFSRLSMWQKMIFTDDFYYHTVGNNKR